MSTPNDVYLLIHKSPRDASKVEVNHMFVASPPTGEGDKAAILRFQQRSLVADVFKTKLVEWLLLAIRGELADWTWEDFMSVRLCKLLTSTVVPSPSTGVSTVSLDFYPETNLLSTSPHLQTIETLETLQKNDAADTSFIAMVNEAKNILDGDSVEEEEEAEAAEAASVHDSDKEFIASEEEDEDGDSASFAPSTASVSSSSSSEDDIQVSRIHLRKRVRVGGDED